jgi:DNA gyrase subunit B
VHLDFPTNIRTRPGMYIGAVDNANVLLRECIDNSVDELYASKKCDTIGIIMNENGYVVMDNGRGIPILMDKDKNITKAKMAVTYISTGSKFNKELTGAGVGQNGVGIKAVNALSTRFAIMSRLTSNNYKDSIPEVKEVYKSRKDEPLFYVNYYEKGFEVKETVMSDKDIQEFFGFEVPGYAMTITFFKPDSEIFTDPSCKLNTENLSYVNLIMDKFYKRSVNILVNGEKMTDIVKPYKFEFITQVRSTKTDEAARFYVTFEIDKSLTTKESAGSVNSLVVDQGRHLDFVRNSYGKALKDAFNITHNYIMYGYKMLVVVLAGEVDFSSQTKERLSKLCSMVGSETELKPIFNEFRKIFKAKENQDYFLNHVERLQQFADSVTNISAIEKVKKMVNVNDGSAKSVFKIPKSVSDASSKDRDLCELFIVEGQSAGGTIRKVRDSRYQAVFFLRGVPKNGINQDLDVLLNNRELNAIISTIGCGVNEYHSTKNPRYGRIIIAADADTDGGHIAALMAGIIAQKMTFLVKEHMLYVLETPLYKQNGIYIYPGEADELLDRSKPYERYKGLGEIDEPDAKIVICNPEKRRLREVTLDGVRDALSILTRTSARRDLMIKNGVLTDPYKVGGII